MVVTQAEVELEADQPYRKVRLHDPVELKCCYSSNDSETVTWFKLVSRNITMAHEFINSTTTELIGKGRIRCGTLLFESVQMSDSGLYQCLLNESNIFSHGTFLHVSSKCSEYLTWLC